MSEALITGITGFVGSHLADFLLDQNVKVSGICRWRSPQNNIKHCIHKIRLYHADLLDLSSLLKCLDEERPAYIFHLAAQSYVPYSFNAPSITLETNCIGTCNLLEAIKILKERDGYSPVIHICSSSEVYGQVKREDVPIRESQPLNPASPYAVSKVCEDMLGLQYWLSYGLKTIRTRMFTHSGPRRGEFFVVSNFAKQIATIEAGKHEPVIYVGNLDSIRTFADVRDTVRAYWLLVKMCEHGEVYNIGGSTTMAVGEMLNKLIALSGRKDIEIKQDPDRLRPSDVTLQIPNTKKFKRKTGWEPKISFEQTLKDTLDYWRESLG
tara:strand:+ start:2699 stop:3670 length:972 start_codon:yes stop_codon:yes gene_type:complete